MRELEQVLSEMESNVSKRVIAAAMIGAEKGKDWVNKELSKDRLLDSLSELTSITIILNMIRNTWITENPDVSGDPSTKAFYMLARHNTEKIIYYRKSFAEDFKEDYLEIVVDNNRVSTPCVELAQSLSIEPEELYEAFSETKPGNFRFIPKEQPKEKKEESLEVPKGALFTKGVDLSNGTASMGVNYPIQALRTEEIMKTINKAVAERMVDKVFKGLEEGGK